MRENQKEVLMERAISVGALLVILAVIYMANPRAIESWSIGFILHAILPVVAIVLLAGLIMTKIGGVFKGW